MSLAILFRCALRHTIFAAMPRFFLLLICCRGAMNCPERHHNIYAMPLRHYYLRATRLPLRHAADIYHAGYCHYDADCHAFIDTRYALLPDSAMLHKRQPCYACCQRAAAVDAERYALFCHIDAASAPPAAAIIYER